MLNKRGVDAIVATVLIIMITVAAVAILWAFVIPMVKDSLSSSTAEKVSLNIETDGGYTVYDSSTGYAMVQVRRGTDDVNITGIDFVFFNGKESKNISSTFVLGKNSVRTYSFNLSGFGEPQKVSLAPIFANGKKGEPVSQVVKFSQGSISEEQAKANSEFRDVNTGCTIPTQDNCVSGLCDGKIIICSCTDLQSMSSNLSGNYLLGRNIDCSEISNFVPIGDATTGFTGIFDGNGNTISFLTINLPSSSYVGLFGNTTNSQIKNVGLTNVNISGSTNVGGLVAYLISSSLSNSYATGTVKGTQQVGGLIATLGNSSLTNSYFIGNVTGTNYLGGLVSYAPSGWISTSFSEGIVNGSGLSSNYIGGLVGYVSNYTYGPLINNSYSTATVYSSATGAVVGGLAGYLSLAAVSNSYATGQIYSSGSRATGAGGFAGSIAYTKINNSYSIGKVNYTLIPSSTISGFVGTTQSSNITNSYWYNYSSYNVSRCSPYDVAPNCIAIPESTGISYFYNAANAPMNTWDFTNVWQANANGLPTLRKI